MCVAKGGEWTVVIMPKPPTTPKTRAPSTEVEEPRRARRKFSAADKLRIVREAAACTERGEVEALLRREGIYSSHLSGWRKAIEEHGVRGIETRRPGRKPSRDAKDARIEALEKKAARLERDLEVAQKLIALQKKVSELLDVTLPTSEEP